MTSKPQLVLGAAQFGSAYGINNISGKPSDDVVRRILHSASTHLIYEVDTAQAYGESETVLGRVLPSLSSTPFVVHSKFILEGNKTISDLLRDSLLRIGVSRLGYFYFHRFSDFLGSESLIEADRPFVEDHSLGLGVSIYDESELEIALRSKFIKAIQIPINVFDRSSKKIELLKHARALGIKIYARSIFLQGVFFSDPKALSFKLEALKEPLSKLDQISKELKISKMELALGFVKSLDVSDCILVGVDSEKQLNSNLLAWHTSLSPEVLRALSSIEVKSVELLKPMNWN